MSGYDPDSREIKEILSASEKIKPYIHKTPLMSSGYINKTLKSNILFKCENFQKAGAFKSRGATNAVFSLSEDDCKRGVTTHSSGNHAAALALAASRRNVKSYIVMPENAPEIIAVDEDSIISAMRRIWERMKIIIELSAAVPLAAVMENIEKFEGKKLTLILSGGNVDLEKLPWSK